MNTTGFDTPSWQIFVVARIKVFAKSGHQAPSWQCPTRGTRRPQLACVQDIRPHVPELGCTSAVQNEKYIFSFCTAESPSYLAREYVLKTRRTRISASPRRLGFDALSWQYMNTTNKSIAILGVSNPTANLAEDVAPKLACVQDIRPHVPELGCTSAVQNEKCIFHFCTAEQLLWYVLNERKLGDASPRRHYQVGVRCLELQIHEYHEYKSIASLKVSTPSWQCQREDASPPSSSLRSRH